MEQRIGLERPLIFAIGAVVRLNVVKSLRYKETNIFVDLSIQLLYIQTVISLAGDIHAMSRIEWTEQTWNPVTGCTKVSPGCKHCYAETMAKRLKAMGVQGYENGFELSHLLPSMGQQDNQHS